MQKQYVIINSRYMSSLFLMMQVHHMQSVKEACLSQDALAAIMTLTHVPLSHHPHMTGEDHMMVQLVITFFRNLLCVPDVAAKECGGGRRSRMQVSRCVRGTMPKQT